MTEYLELHTHSCFSLLDGASSPEALVERAAQLGMPALALTDHDAVYGAVRFSQAAAQHGVKPIFGAELTLEDNRHLTLLVKDASGWHNLCQLITLARHNAPKGEACLPLEALAAHTNGLIALTGCRKGQIAQALLCGEKQKAVHAAQQLIAWFGHEQVWVELQHHVLTDDDLLVDDLVRLAQHLNIRYVATNNVHYVHQDDHALQDVLVCIRHNTTLDEAIHRLRPNSEYFLKSAQEMMTQFQRYPSALANTLHIAQQCNFTLTYGLQELPLFPTPDGSEAHDYLQHLCQQRMVQLNLIAEKIQSQLQHELAIIQQAGLSNYFLIVWDIVRFANQQQILCQGRGSAANSLTAYLLGISPINPLAHDLVFERFLSDERRVVPDIDIDFDAARREEVIQYVYQRYGHERAAMACTFVTFRAKSAMRDVGKVLGMPPVLLDHLNATLDVYRAAEVAKSPTLRDTLGSRLLSQTWQQLLDLCRQIDGLPRHLGIHNGGMVVTGVPLASRLPTEPATMDNRFVVQWDKEGLEAAGLVKIDILGLRMLSAVAQTVEMVGQSTGVRPNLEALTFDDPEVYDLICTADTVGVFQVESRAQAQVLPRLRPRQFADLIVSISLIRPGPVQGEMVHPYLRRRSGEEAVTCFHPLLEPALQETLGVILFQEQVLKVARDLAGFTPGQGELLRRALGAKDATQAISQFHERFIQGAKAKGVDEHIAEDVFDKLRAFGSYSFPKSHAAAFAVLVYRSAWLKRYHPAAFFAALLNNQPMGFWSPAVLIHDAERHGIPILPVDVNLSGDKCTLESKGIRLGLNYVRGFGEQVIQQVLTVRGNTPFNDLSDLCRRTQLPRRLVEFLIQAGALEGWGSRRELFWKLGTLRYTPNALPFEETHENVSLPALSTLEAADMEFSALGLSLGQHPMVVYRATLASRGVLSSEDLEHTPDGQMVQTAGVIVVHQSPPTAKGFHFITLEDEFGFINVICSPKVYARFRRVIRGTNLLLVWGKVQREGEVINLIAGYVILFSTLTNI